MNSLPESAAVLPMNRTSELVTSLRFEIQKAELSDLPALAGALEELRVEVQLRLTGPSTILTPETTGDQLLTVGQVAQRLGQKPRWVYSHRKELPVVSLPGRSVRISERRLESFIRRRSCS